MPSGLQSVARDKDAQSGMAYKERLAAQCLCNHESTEGSTVATVTVLKYLTRYSWLG